MNFVLILWLCGDKMCHFRLICGFIHFTPLSIVWLPNYLLKVVYVSKFTQQIRFKMYLTMHESRNENSSHNSHVNVISKLQNHASLQKSIAIKVKLQCSVQKTSIHSFSCKLLQQFLQNISSNHKE